jgi:hypothetical protein
MGISFNSYFYLGLVFFSLVLLTYTWMKSRSVRSLMHFLAMVGLGYAIEGVIYVLLGSYQYMPEIIQHNSYYDSNLGAVASNTLALPVTATFLSVFRLRWVWIAAFTLLFVGIEWLFLELNIYIHYWWTLGYTALGLPIYYATAKMIYKQLLHPIQGFLHSIILLLMLGAISGTLHILPILFFENRFYEPGWFENSARDTTAFSFLYYSCISLICIVLVRLQWIPKWLKYTVMAVLICTVTVILTKVGILHSLIWWDQPYYVLLPCLVLGIGEVVSKRLSNGPYLQRYNNSE